MPSAGLRAVATTTARITPVNATACTHRARLSKAVVPSTAPRAWDDIVEAADIFDISDPTLMQLAMLPADSADPIEPIDPTLPTEQIESTEPVLAMLRKESSDPMEKRDAMSRR